MAESLMTHMVAHYPDRERSLEVARAFVDGGASYLLQLASHPASAADHS